MDNLKPGRELDALIAEKVMGHEIWKSAFTDMWADNTKGGTVAPYSTDISAAWEVVGKLQSMGKSFEIVWSLDKGNPSFCVSNTDRECIPYPGWAFSDDNIVISSWSAPHAICLAALKAVGHE